MADYITGISKALEPFFCTYPSPAAAAAGVKPFLTADASIVCWEGTHLNMIGLNVVAFLVYVPGMLGLY